MNTPFFLCPHAPTKRASIIFILLMFLSFPGSNSYAQIINAKQAAKLSPAITAKLKSNQPKGLSVFTIAVSDHGKFSQWINDRSGRVKLIYEYKPSNTFVVKADWKNILDTLLATPYILFIDEQRVPKEELQVANLDLSVNKINLVHNEYPQWNGNATTLSVKENKMDTTDIDFKGRFLSTTLSSPTTSAHASIMATMAAGGGNSWHLGKGAAWGADIASSDFTNLLPDADAAYQQYKISVQNHSYGVGVESFYGADAAAYDASTISNPSLLHIFSSGNSGTTAPAAGFYAGVQGFANLTGSFKMAKNIITVGATDSFEVMAAMSSKGPAHDGRVKPELVAFGEDGSSGSAALVSGIALTLQQAYKETHGNTLPSSALVKAILLNSADDVNAPGIDYASGYGSANAYKAMNTLSAARYFTGNISEGATQTFSLAVPAGIKKLKITLVWNDPPAAPNAAKALINDLDLELKLSATNESWKPWVLNSHPHSDSLQLLSVRKRDSLNNVEQVTLDNPVAGNYMVDVKGFSGSSSQNFVVTYQFDSTGIFKWHYPTKSDFVLAAGNTLRWQSSFAATTGLLEYTMDGITWLSIDPAVDLRKGYYQWMAPDINHLAKLRMNIAAQNFSSDTFAVSTRLKTGVGFDCIDSFLIHWNKIPGITNYNVYRLNSEYLGHILTTSDTVAILSKNSNPSLYYAVAPVIEDRAGVKSYTFNYTTQGVDCYIRSFLILLSNNAVELDLELGTNYSVQKIVWEKIGPTGYKDIQSSTDISGLHFSYTDNAPAKGLSTYRVRIELSNGKIIYSDPETVYFTGDENYIVYPNPSAQYQEINILSKEINNAVMQVFTVQGMKVYEVILSDLIHSIPTGKLSKGFYFIRILSEGKENTLRLVVY